MSAALEDSSYPLRYNAARRHVGIDILDGTESVMTIKFCMWCGAELPKDLWNEWWDKLHALGIEDDGDPRVPASMQSDLWWKEDGL